MGGATLGVLIGRLVLQPIRDWERAIIEAWLDITPYLVVMLAVVWTIMTPADSAARVAGVPWLGMLAIVAAILIHARGGSRAGYSWSGYLLGLALLTGSMFVIMVASFAIVGMLVRIHAETSTERFPYSRPRRLAEGVLALSVAIALHTARGLLPIL